MFEIIIPLFTIGCTSSLVFYYAGTLYNQIIYPINKATETVLYQEDALKVIQDKEGCEELNRIVKEYHKTGNWDMEALRKLTAKFK